MMNVFGITKSFIALLIASSLTFGLIASSHADTLGAGIAILDLPDPNIQVDTPSDGTTDQSRQNLDQDFTATLDAGEYVGTSWSFRAGQAGSVIPYIALATGPDSYEILAVGSEFNVTSDLLDIDLEGVPFGGSSFTLSSSTEIFGGIVNPTEAGSQNPIYTNINSGFTMDHDNNADGQLSPAVVGGTVDGFGHANLGRSYAFSIEVDPVPEPSTALVITVLSGLAVFVIRRR
jgi:hypothetical protein